MVRRTLKLVLLAAIVIVFVDFAIANREAVGISIFPFPYVAEMPKFLLFVLFFAFGSMAGGIAVSLKLSKAKRLIVTERKRIVALENELKGRREERTALPAKS